MSEHPKDDKHWEQYRKPKETEMKKTKPHIRILLGFSMIMLMMIVIVFQSCDDDSTITGGIIPEPELTGCEGSTFYDWDSVEFESSLDGGTSTWLAFELEETTLLILYK